MESKGYQHQARNSSYRICQPQKTNGACMRQAPLPILLIYIFPHMQNVAQNFGLVSFISLNKESEQPHYCTTQVTKMGDMKKSKKL